MNATLSPFGPRCRLFNIGPKVGPPPFVNVQEWGCFSIFLRSDDVTRTMSKEGGVLVKNPVSAPGPPPPFQKSWIRACRQVHYTSGRPVGVVQREAETGHVCLYVTLCLLSAVCLDILVYTRYIIYYSIYYSFINLLPLS